MPDGETVSTRWICLNELGRQINAPKDYTSIGLDRIRFEVSRNIKIGNFRRYRGATTPVGEPIQYISIYVEYDIPGEYELDSKFDFNGKEI